MKSNETKGFLYPAKAMGRKPDYGIAEKHSPFNSYYENIDYNFWHTLFVEKGVLRHYDKGELFAEERIRHSLISQYHAYTSKQTAKK